MVDGFEFLEDICPIHSGNNYLIEVSSGVTITESISSKIYKFLQYCGYNGGILSKVGWNRKYHDYHRFTKLQRRHQSGANLKHPFSNEKGMMLILRDKIVKYTYRLEGEELERAKNGKFKFQVITLQELIKIINEHNIKKWKDTKN